MNNSYMRFLQNISSSSVHSPIKNDLSPTAISLLNAIAIKVFEGISITVSQAMEFKSLGSPANLHLKLDELRHADLVLVTNIGTDRRTKYIFLTQLARDFFQFNNEAMLNAIKSK